MRQSDNEETVRKARADLKRLHEQSEKLLGARNPDDGIDENDPIELWGKRIDRTIGYVVVMILIYHLTTTYFIK